MLFIHCCDCANLPLNGENIQRCDRGIQGKAGNGILYLPNLNPRNAIAWEGFEFAPVGFKGRFALFNSDRVPYRYENMNWQIGSEPHWLAGADLRLALTDWSQQTLIIGVEIPADSVIESVKIGARIPQNYLDYIARFGLPSQFSLSVSHSTWLTPSNPLEIEYPSYPPRELLEKVEVWQPGRRTKPAILGTNSIEVTEELDPNLPTQLIYTLRLTPEYYSGSFQPISDPCIVITRDRQGSNHKSLEAYGEFIQIDNDRAYVCSWARSVSWGISFIVYASDSELGAAIAQELFAKACRVSKIELPVWDTEIGFSIGGGISYSSSISLANTEIEAWEFQGTLLELPLGQTIEVVKKADYV